MKTERILIVEDEMIISATIEEKLNTWGYENIDIANNAENASRLLSENEYDVILMDINLGSGKSGVDLIIENGANRELPVIFISGNSDQKTINQVKHTKPYGFVTKPILENNLKIQLELSLHKEKLRKLEYNEEQNEENPYTGNCDGLSIVLNMEGQILAMSYKIRKITGRSSISYLNKNIKFAGFEKIFYELLNKCLIGYASRHQTTFYGEITSPFIGKRRLKVNISPLGLFSISLKFSDITEQSDINDISSCNLAIASTNEFIVNGFGALSTMITGARISAFLKDDLDVIKYLQAMPKGILMIESNFPKIRSILRAKSEIHNSNLKLLILVSNYLDFMKIKNLAERCSDGFIYSSSNDATIMEAVHQLRTGKKYFENSILERISIGTE